MNKSDREAVIDKWLARRRVENDVCRYWIDEKSMTERAATPFERKVAAGYRPTYNEVRKIP